MNERSTRLLERLDAVGLDHVGVADGERLRGVVLPDRAGEGSKRSGELGALLVVASAGPRFWRAFEEHCASDAASRARTDPLDDFTRLVVAEACAEIQDARVFFPFYAEEPRLPFQRLGEAAGLGRPGPLGLLVHPKFGPWFALRAAVALPFGLPSTPAADDVCARCADTPCIAACPAGAIARSGCDLNRCVAQIATGRTCQTRCDAREACPIGREHRYPPDEVTYHHRHAFGRFMKAVT